MGNFAENLNLGKCVLPPWKFEFIASICGSPLGSTFPQMNQTEIISLWNESRVFFFFFLHKSCIQDLI